jgi:hypothetical protein
VTVLLAVGRGSILVDDSIVSALRGAIDLSRFVTPSAAAPLLTVTRTQEPSEGLPVDLERRGQATYRVEEGHLDVAGALNDFEAELVLRAAFEEALRLQGGVLFHASAVAFSGRAVVAVGPSGAGKSTLARLCRDAGGGILSDELVGVLGDGTAWATPFFSETDLLGTVQSAAIGHIVILAKDSRERVDEVAPGEALSALTAQTLVLPGAEPSKPDHLARLGALVERPGVKRLAFALRPGAGTFVREWVSQRAGKSTA